MERAFKGYSSFFFWWGIDVFAVLMLSSSGLPSILVSALVTTAISFLGMWIRKYTWVDLGFSSIQVRSLFLWLSILLAYELLVLKLNSALGMGLAVQPIPEIPIMELVGLCALAPFGEEVLCRGLLFRILKEIGTGRAILLTAIAFSLTHYGKIAGLPSADIVLMLIEYFGVGLILGLSRRKTNSLLPPIVMHVALNLALLARGRFLFNQL